MLQDSSSMDWHFDVVIANSKNTNNNISSKLVVNQIKSLIMFHNQGPETTRA